MFFTETCEGCLIISVNATTTAVGDIVMVNCSMNRGSHTGITLFINSVASTNPSADMRCSTESIQGHLVTYYCIAKKRGVMNITANTEFCDIVVDSQQIGITIEEQRMHNITEDHHGTCVIGLSNIYQNVCKCELEKGFLCKSNHELAFLKWA